jgi:hypothetical protein
VEFEIDWYVVIVTRYECIFLSTYVSLQYPDLRAMGYPFDRLSRSGADTMSAFVTPNMRLQDVSIVFNDRTVERPRQ